MTKVISISGTRHNPRKKLPRAADLAEFIRSGDTCDDIAAAFGCSPRTVAQRLNDAGFNATTGEPWEDKPAERVVVGLPFDPQPWAADAACASVGPVDFWFPDKGAGTNADTLKAKDICGRCPVRAACLAYAMRNNETGIWGGLTETERRDLRRGLSPIKECGGCGGVFESADHRKRYCSRRCKDAAATRRRVGGAA